MKRSPVSIFISYRRSDTAGHAGRLHDALVQRFGPAHVFRDIGGIQPGMDFTEKIETELSRCQVFIALMGERWLTIADSEGRRRLDDPQDSVRRELEIAFDLGLRVIPVRLQNAPQPRESHLPPSLAKLARLQTHELSEDRWTHDVGTLIRYLEATENEAARGRMKRWRSRKVLAAAGALVAAAAAGVAALLLVSGGPAHGQAALEKGADFFASPSKNIQCGHFPSAKLVGCRTNNNDRTAFVPLTRRPYALPHPPSGYAALFSRATRGLGYGRSWLARGDFRCDSADSGMTCRSVRSRRGFKICREGIDILPSQAGKRTFCYRR